MAGEHWWEAPAGVADLTPPQRVAFGLVCVEHLLPSVALQVVSHPRSLPPGLAVASLQGCLDALWAWLAAPDGPPPGCVTEEQAREAYDGAPVGLTSLVINVYTAVWAAIRSFTHPEDTTLAGGEVLETIGALLGGILDPLGGLSALAATGRQDLLGLQDEMDRRQADARSAEARHELVGIETRAQAEAYEALAAARAELDRREAEPPDALARHELVAIAARAQDDTYEALRAGADPRELRAPAHAVGEAVATWTAWLLEGAETTP